MQTGIIGLPQVGKTTLFKILTRAHLDEKAARAATHVGIARVPEPRLEKLAEIYHPKKVTYATVEYVDVGGMVKDRAKDSAVLAPLREVDALAHVLRVFDDPAVAHPAGSIDPLRDAESLDLELMLTDLDQIARRIERVEKDLKKKKEPQLEQEFVLLQHCKTAIESEKPLRELDLHPDERKLITGFKFLSQRPMLYVLNLGDDEVGELESAVERHKLAKLASRPNTEVVSVCGRIEAELAELEPAEATELLAAYGLKSSGLDRLIHATSAQDTWNRFLASHTSGDVRSISIQNLVCKDAKSPCNDRLPDGSLARPDGTHYAPAAASIVARAVIDRALAVLRPRS